MQMDPRKLISPHFDFLIDELGFKVAASEVFPEAFGNAYVILCLDDLRIQIATDRGDLYTLKKK